MAWYPLWRAGGGGWGWVVWVSLLTLLSYDLDGYGLIKFVLWGHWSSFFVGITLTDTKYKLGGEKRKRIHIRKMPLFDGKQYISSVFVWSEGTHLLLKCNSSCSKNSENTNTMASCSKLCKLKLLWPKKRKKFEPWNCNHHHHPEPCKNTAAFLCFQTWHANLQCQ